MGTSPSGQGCFLLLEGEFRSQNPGVRIKTLIQRWMVPERMALIVAMAVKDFSTTEVGREFISMLSPPCVRRIRLNNFPWFFKIYLS